MVYYTHRQAIKATADTPRLTLICQACFKQICSIFLQLFYAVGSGKCVHSAWYLAVVKYLAKVFTWTILTTIKYFRIVKSDYYHMHGLILLERVFLKVFFSFVALHLVALSVSPILQLHT